METSGTIGQTQFEVRRVIDAAFRRCRLPEQAITSEMIESAKDQLWLVLASMQSQTLPLWAQDRQVLGLREGQLSLDTPVGTIDIIQANLRTLRQVLGAETTASDRITTDIGTAQVIESVGFQVQAGTFALTIETSDDDSTYTARETLASATYETGAWVWVDLDPTVSARYWRLRETTGAAITVDEFYLGTGATEINLGRTSLDTHATLPNRATRGRPTQFWVDRRFDRPRIELWPSPDTANAKAQVVIWRHRHIMDVGTLRNKLEIPRRWHDAIVAVLAYRMAMETPAVDMNVIPMLKAASDEASLLMAANEKDASPMRIRFGIGRYT